MVCGAHPRQTYETEVVGAPPAWAAAQSCLNGCAPASGSTSGYEAGLGVRAWAEAEPTGKHDTFSTAQIRIDTAPVPGDGVLPPPANVRAFSTDGAQTLCVALDKVNAYLGSCGRTLLITCTRAVFQHEELLIRAAYCR
jgi:hypothetical protein